MQRLLVGRLMVVLVLILGLASVSPAQQLQVLPGTLQQRLAPQLGEAVQPSPTVTVAGEVLRPGAFPFVEGMRVKNLLARAGGLSTEASAVHGQILRTTRVGDLRTLFFSPAAALRGERRDNLPLQAGDRVLIFSTKEALRGGELPAVADLSSIEQLVAGRIPASDVPLRQFGYDLFARVPVVPRPPEEEVETLEPSRREIAGVPFQLRRGLEQVGRLGQQGAIIPPGDQRFEAPVMDLRFTPSTTDVPVGPDYVIGPGDSLNVVLWGGVEDFYQVEVNRNGAIILPRLGVVQIWGMTLEQLEKLLRQRFGQYYPDFQMAVTLGRLRTIRVYVVGEVQQSGAYNLSSLSTIINALFTSGGPTKNGTLRNIRLLRQGKLIHTVDLYDFLLQGDKSQDQTLQSGDTIFVPVIGPVAGVAGNVRRPAIYEIEPGITLQRLLELAGGVTPLGYLQRVHVERFVANEGKVVVDLDLSASRAEMRSLWQTRIEDGDLVRIFPIDTRLENVVQLEGHVVRPGRYELKPGMRLRDLLPSHGALLSETYLDYAEIVRRSEPDKHRRVVPFNLGALLAGDAAHSLALQPQDTVRIFARDDFVDPRLVRVSGLVHRPGIYPLTEGMRVRDLVLRAANVHKFAYLENAELTRRVLGAEDVVATRVEINLRQALAGDAEHNLLLQGFDHLLVRQAPGVNLRREVTPPTFFPLQEDDEQAMAVLRRAGIVEERTVELDGEVRFPGVYPILKGERLSSVLQRAGGYTNRAYLRGAVFTRERVRVAQEKRLQALIREEEQALITEGALGAAAALSAEEVQARQTEVALRRSLLAAIEEVKPEGRMVIRLQPLAVFAGSDQDIELESGDRLLIPQASKYVNVEGQVYNRTALIYQPGRNIGYYLDQVGGLKPQANEKEILLVQIDGTVISRRQDQYASVLADGQTAYLGDFFAIQPQPGDTIVVPRKVKSPAGLRATRDIIQIIFQSVSTLALVLALL